MDITNDVNPDIIAELYSNTRLSSCLCFEYAASVYVNSLLQFITVPPQYTYTNQKDLL